MIVSRYTFCFSYGSDEWYVYNTLSNALLEIDKDSFKLLKDAQSGNRRLKKDLFDEELWAVLTDKRFIVNNCKDEFLVYKSIINAQRTQTEFMHLTIAPTMDCNFRCHYCFQNNKRHSYMQPDVMEAIVKHVASQTGLKRIRLTWFGGEPLMAVERIRELYGKLKTR